MARFTSLLIAAIGLSSALAGQTPAPDNYQFEVASVALVTDAQTGLEMSGGPGTSDPGKIRFTGISMSLLLARAYGVSEEMISGPNWLGTSKYAIVANVPIGATKEQVKLMLQNLLAERFHLACHQETRGAGVYELAASAKGLKLKESPDGPESDDSPQGLGRDEMGFPKLPPGAHTMAGSVMAGDARYSFGRFSMGDLAQWLRFQLNTTVVDQTGLTKRYDFHLQFDPPPRFHLLGSPDPENPSPTLADALEGQLGLKLRQTKGSVTVLVIDRVNRTPVAN